MPMSVLPTIVRHDCVCVAAGSPHLHALHCVLCERSVCRLSGPPAAGNPQRTCSRDSGGAQQPVPQPSAGEQGDTTLCNRRARVSNTVQWVR